MCGSDGSGLLYQTLNYKKNLGQIQSFAAVCPVCAHSEEAEALLLIQRWVWEKEQNFEQQYCQTSFYWQHLTSSLGKAADSYKP